MSDPFWLLSVHVAPGQQTPYHLWILWSYFHAHKALVS